MNLMRMLAVLIGLALGGWLVFDGARAFATGDYLTPRTGPRAGQLGPWARVVSSLGLDPRGKVIKSAHIALGLLWLGAVAMLLLKPPLGWRLLIAAALGSLWYLPMGTVLGIAVLVLAFVSGARQPG